MRLGPDDREPTVEFRGWELKSGKDLVQGGARADKLMPRESSQFSLCAELEMVDSW